jgi:hypothetical protein
LPAQRWDLVVDRHSPSRSALDFLDAPQRISTALDGRMMRLLVAPAMAGSVFQRAGSTLFARAVTTVIGAQVLTDTAGLVQAMDSMFGGFRKRAEATYQNAAPARDGLRRGGRGC